MITAKLFVPSGAPLHERGRVALAPSQVNSLGSAPPSVTSELVSMNVPFDEVGSMTGDAFPGASGGVGGVPGASEQPASNKAANNSESVFMFSFR